MAGRAVTGVSRREALAGAAAVLACKSLGEIGSKPVVAAHPLTAHDRVRAGHAAIIDQCHDPVIHNRRPAGHPLPLRPPRRQRGIVRFGANSEEWRNFSRAVTKAGIVRDYWHGTDHIEPLWPQFRGRPRVLLSFEPHPEHLRSGLLDARILQLAETAPRGSMLTPWYEAGPNNCRGYPKFVTGTAVRECQWYLHRLLRHTNVRVGSVICGPADQLTGWMARGLDFYGDDTFGDWFTAGGVLEVTRFEVRQISNLATWRHLAGRPWPAVLIPETSSSHPEWYSLLASWWARRGGAGICTFWSGPRGCQGSEAKRWPPPRAVITEIRRLSALYGPPIRLW